MIKKLLLLLLLSVVLLCSGSFASGDWELGLLLDAATFSLLDSADSIYIGTVSGTTNIGIGGHATYLWPINDNMKWGGNFQFTYNQYLTNWYTIHGFFPSVGPQFTMNWGENSMDIFANFTVLGWVSTEQEITGSGSLAPAGSFNANASGYLIGIRGKYKVADWLVLGPYATWGNMTWFAFKYNTLVSGSYSARWIDLGINHIQAGLVIYLDQYFKTKKS